MFLSYFLAGSRSNWSTLLVWSRIWWYWDCYSSTIYHTFIDWNTGLKLYNIICSLLLVYLLFNYTSATWHKLIHPHDKNNQILLWFFLIYDFFYVIFRILLLLHSWGYLTCAYHSSIHCLGQKESIVLGLALILPSRINLPWFNFLLI